MCLKSFKHLLIFRSLVEIICRNPVIYGLCLMDLTCSLDGGNKKCIERIGGDLSEYAAGRWRTKFEFYIRIMSNNGPDFIIQ